MQIFVIMKNSFFFCGMDKELSALHHFMVAAILNRIQTSHHLVKWLFGVPGVDVLFDFYQVCRLGALHVVFLYEKLIILGQLLKSVKNVIAPQLLKDLFYLEFFVFYSLHLISESIESLWLLHWVVVQLFLVVVVHSAFLL